MPEENPTSSGLTKDQEKRVLRAARKGKMGTVDVQLRSTYQEPQKLKQLRLWAAETWKTRMEEPRLTVFLSMLDTKLAIHGIVIEKPTPAKSTSTQTTAVDTPKVGKPIREKKPKLETNPDPREEADRHEPTTITKSAPPTKPREVRQMAKDTRIKILQAARKGKWTALKNRLDAVEDPAQIRGLAQFASEHWQKQLPTSHMDHLQRAISDILGEDVILSTSAPKTPRPKGPAPSAKPKAPKNTTPPQKVPTPAKKTEPAKPPEPKPQKAPTPAKKIKPRKPSPPPKRAPKPRGPAPSARPRSQATNHIPRRRSAEGR